MRLILPALVVILAIATLRADTPAFARVTAPAPDSFRVAFETSRGRFVVVVRRKWAPVGADRFYELVRQHFFDNARFFRTLPGFVAQFGLNADPKHNEWMKKPLKDDPVRQSNAHGTITFASMMVPNTRSQQLFINLRDNPQLDRRGSRRSAVWFKGSRSWIRSTAAMARVRTRIRSRRAAMRI